MRASILKPMLQSISGADIAHVIQLAVAPVFLLAGLGSILGVMANRLARVVDRARILESRLPGAGGALHADLHERLAMLSLRAKLIGRAIALCTLSALLVCAVIIILFVGAIFTVRAALPAALLFMAGLLSFAGALLLFLREIFLATASLKIGTMEKPP